MRLIRPDTLEVGAEYLLQARGALFLEHIRFAAYDPCPAFVIVSSGAGQKRRCLRDDIFTLAPACLLPVPSSLASLH